MAIDDISNGFASPNGEGFSSTSFTTAEGADVFEMEVSNIDGGNDFNVTVNNHGSGDPWLLLFPQPTS